MTKSISSILPLSRFLNPKLKSPSSLYVLIILFMTNVLTIISTIYSSTIFLSAYPRTWLAYLLMTQSVVTILCSFALNKAFSSEVKRNTIIILLIFISAIVSCIYLSAHTTFWVPFIIAVLIGTIGVLWNFVTWNIVPLAFDSGNIRKYILMVLGLAWLVLYSAVF